MQGCRTTCPSGAVIEWRLPTLADLEATDGSSAAILQRVVRSIGGTPVEDMDGTLEQRDAQVLAELVSEHVFHPSAEVARLLSGFQASNVVPVAGGVQLRPPTVSDVKDAQGHGATLRGDLALVRKCIVAVDGQPTSYLELTSRWPFDLPDTMLLREAVLQLTRPTMAELAAARTSSVVVDLD